MSKFPRRPKGKLTCDKLKKLTQQVANYNYDHSLTPAQVKKGNRWEAMLRSSKCRKPFNIANYRGQIQVTLWYKCRMNYPMINSNINIVY